MITIYKEVKQVDILAIGVHPDDVELSCAGTLMSHIALGHTAGIVDLTKGELGTRGSATIRMSEASAAAEILGVDFRVNLEMRDGFFSHDERHMLRVAEIIRQTRPRIVLANAITDRHPDHGRAAALVRDAFFYAGLRRIDIAGTTAYRPQALYHYIQDRHLTPDLCVDVTGYEDRKRQAIEAFATQFFTGGDQSGEPQTPISSSDFMESVFAKMRVFGRSIGVPYAEGYNADRTVGATDLLSLI